MVEGPAANLVTIALIEQTVADEGARHALVHLSLHRGHRGRIESADFMKYHSRRPVRGVGKREAAATSHTSMTALM